MPQLDITTFSSQIIWLMITFSVLFIIMWQIAIPRITGVLESRQRRIDDNLDKAAVLKKEAEATIETYEISIAKTRTEANSLINGVTQRIQAETAEMDAKIGEKLQVQIANGEAVIAKAKETAMTSVYDVARDVAITATEKLSGEKPHASVADAAIDAAMKAQS